VPAAPLSHGLGALGCPIFFVRLTVAAAYFACQPSSNAAAISCDAISLASMEEWASGVGTSQSWRCADQSVRPLVPSTNVAARSTFTAE